MKIFLIISSIICLLIASIYGGRILMEKGKQEFRELVQDQVNQELMKDEADAKIWREYRAHSKIRLQEWEKQERIKSEQAGIEAEKRSEQYWKGSAERQNKAIAETEAKLMKNKNH